MPALAMGVLHRQMAVGRQRRIGPPGGAQFTGAMFDTKKISGTVSCTELEVVRM